MGAIDNTRLENDMIDHMWSFLQMGGLKSNYPALKSACMELRQMMMQKTAGQRKDRPHDIPFDNLERVKATIIVEAMALVLSGDLENQPVAKAMSEEDLEDMVSAAEKNASALKDFCFEWDCSVCPFEEGQKKCVIQTPASWDLRRCELFKEER